MSAEIKKEIKLEIAHVLFMDIVGYSKRLINEQRTLLEELNQIVRSTEEFRNAETAGKLIKIPTGDGMALIFYDSPETPVECALEISRVLKTHPNLRLRMGVHSGPVSGVIDVNQRANVAGAGINMAQRVMDCGDAGHILLSRHVAEDLEEYERWRPLLHDLGPCEVKHGVRIGVVNLYNGEVGNPQLPRKLHDFRTRRAHLRWLAVGSIVLVLAATIASLVLLLHTRNVPAVATTEKSIAVLPFENLSEDKANAYFADGVQDEVLTLLSKIADLKVISRTSTQHYKSAPENLPQIARQLGVAHVLEGSVQKSGDSVRVNVQLIKAANDAHLWADTFDRKLTDIFSVESEIAKSIADQLRVKLTGKEEQTITAKPTDNPAAYDAYLRGLAFAAKTRIPAEYLGAQKYLREAIRLDPKFALARAQLSYVDAFGYLTKYLQPTFDLREEARREAETALILQPNLGEAVLATGYYHYACLKDYDTALRYFEQANQLLPNSSQIPESLAFLTRRRGQWDRSEAYFNQAERLDPRNVDLLSQHALSYMWTRRFSDALRKLDDVLNIAPDDAVAPVLKANVAQAEGDLTRAAALIAPLTPKPDEPGLWETLTYQAILERRPAQIISRLKEILAKPDPALGYLNGELRSWLGWAQQVAGDGAAAKASWQQARGELQFFLQEQPENYTLLGDLALTDAMLGDKQAAFFLAERAVATIPIDKDAVEGPVPLEMLARVASQTGEPDRAIPALEKLLTIPNGGALVATLTPALLRLDPMFDPLRSDPRFQKLASSTPK